MSNDEIVIGGDSADIPPGTYEAKLIGTEVRASDEWGEFRTWDFELANGSTVGGASSMFTGKRSKGGRWIAALLGHEPKAGENVTAAIAGASCLVVVGLDKNDWPKVTDVLPGLAPTAAGKAPPAAAEVDAALTAGKAVVLSDLPF